MTGSVFKSCSCCGELWPTRDAFLDDAGLRVIGYQADFRELRLGLFLFNHERCRSTLGVAAGEFVDLHRGPVFEERKTGSEECPGYCLREDELSPCPVACECAFVRDVLQLLRDRPVSTTQVSRTQGRSVPDAS